MTKEGRWRKIRGPAQIWGSDGFSASTNLKIPFKKIIAVDSQRMSQITNLNQNKRDPNFFWHLLRSMFTFKIASVSPEILRKLILCTPLPPPKLWILTGTQNTMKDTYPHKKNEPGSLVPFPSLPFPPLPSPSLPFPPSSFFYISKIQDGRKKTPNSVQGVGGSGGGGGPL